jgi:hypothetical protein
MAVEDIGARRLAEVDTPDRYRDRLGLASSAAVSASPPRAMRRKAALPTRPAQLFQANPSKTAWICLVLFVRI